MYDSLKGLILSKKNIQKEKQEEKVQNKIKKQINYIYNELNNFSICRILKDSYKNKIEEKTDYIYNKKVFSIINITMEIIWKTVFMLI